MKNIRAVEISFQQPLFYIVTRINLRESLKDVLTASIRCRTIINDIFNCTATGTEKR